MVSGFTSGDLTENIIFTADTSGAVAGIGMVQGRLHGFSTTLRGAGIQLQMFGQSILGMVVKTVGAFMTWEDAFIGVRKTVNATEEEFQLLEDGLRNMAMEIPVAAADLAGIMKIAGQMGVRGVENLLEFTRTVAEMGASTDMTEEQISFAFARIAEITNLPIASIHRLGSVIVELGNTFATTEPLITDAAVRAAGAAQILGLSQAELIGSVAAATVVMPRAQSAGSSLTRIWVEMAAASFDGGQKLDTFARVMGLTADETTRLIKQDPAEAFIRFIEGFDKSVKAGDNWVETLKDVGLNNIRTRELVLNLASSEDLLRRTIGAANIEWEENNALTEESTRAWSTLSSNLKILRNWLAEITILMGAALAPYMQKVIDRLRPFIRLVQVWVKENPRVVAAVLILAVALGILAIAAGTAMIVVAVGSMIGFLFSGVGIAILVIFALVAAFGALIVFWPEISAAAKEFWENIKTIYSEEGLGGLFKRFGEYLGVAWDYVKEWTGKIATWVVEWLAETWERWRGPLKELGVEIRNQLKNLGVWIRNKLKEFGVWIRNELKEFGVWILNKLKDIGIGMWNKIKEWGTLLRNKLKEFGMGIKNTLRDKFDQLITPVERAAKEIWKTMVFYFHLIKDVVIPFALKWIKNYFTFYFNLYKTIVMTVFNFIKGFISDNFGWMVPYIKAGLFIVWTIFKMVWGIIKTYVKFVWDILVTIVKTAFNILVPLIKFGWAVVKFMFVTAWDFVVMCVKIAWAVIKNYVLIGVYLITGIIGVAMALLRGDWGTAWDIIKETVGNIWDSIKEIIMTGVDEAWKFIVGLGLRIWNMRDEFLEVGKSVGKAILDGLLEMFDTTLDFAKDVGKQVVNAMISLINTLIINKLNDISLPMPFGLPDVEFPNIPPIPTILGQGGIAMNPTLAIVGDVPEAIIPLDRLGGFGEGMQFWAPVYLTIEAEEPYEAFDRFAQALKQE